MPAAVLRHFDLTNTPYDEEFAEDVARRRRSFPDQKLFLDRLFDLINIDGMLPCLRSAQAVELMTCREHDVSAHHASRVSSSTARCAFVRRRPAEAGLFLLLSVA